MNRIFIRMAQTRSLLDLPVMLLDELLVIFKGAVGVPSSIGEVMSLMTGVDSSSSSSLVRPMLIDLGSLKEDLFTIIHLLGHILCCVCCIRSCLLVPSVVGVV